MYINIYKHVTKTCETPCFAVNSVWPRRWVIDKFEPRNKFSVKVLYPGSKNISSVMQCFLHDLHSFFSLLQGMKKLGILKRLVRWSKFQHEATKETKEETYKHGLYRGTSLHSIAWKIHANHLMTIWEHKLFFVLYFELFAFCDAFFCGISWMASSFWVGSNLKKLTALIASLVSLACIKRKLRTNELSKQVKCGDTLGFTRSIHLPVILWKQFCSRAV